MINNIILGLSEDIQSLAYTIVMPLSFLVFVIHNSNEVLLKV